MGRPLFSQSYRSKPAVRTEPDSGYLSYNRWNHWDAFDPDSEEFFANDPVYEAFIDPSINPISGEEEEQTLVVEESISSGSSEGSVSDRGSPMAVGSDDPVRMLAEAYPSVDWEQRFVQTPPISADARPATRWQPTRYAPRFNANAYQQGAFARGSRPRSATVTVIPQRAPPAASQRGFATSPTDNLPRTSDITPIFAPRAPAANLARSPETAQQPFIPVTPPSQRAPLGQTTPSPPPTVTPRILSWSSRPPMSPGSPPQSNSPLTNPSARMSLAHIAPALLRVRDVVI